MSSDYEFSDEDNEYYDEDEEMREGDEDGESLSPRRYFTNTEHAAVRSASSEADDMELDAFNEEIKLPQKGKKKAYEVEYDDFTQQAVEGLMKADMDHIVSLFGVNSDTASLLLRYIDWNKDRLIDKYLDNSSAISIAAGITPAPPPAKSPSPGPERSNRRVTRSSKPATPLSKKSSAPPVESEPFVCPICFDDTQTDTLALACEHSFCAGCWGAYVESKIRSEGEHRITCMAEACSVVAPDTFVRRALESSDAVADPKGTWSRFQDLLIRHFVSCNPNLKFCPYPSCTHTVSCPSAATKSSLLSLVPTVTCGADPRHRFCFGCSVEGDHRPVLCAVAKMWLQKCRDDSETANWIKSNTKECSKCQSTIEKNGGCNHMTCKKCKYEFCWVCMGPWSEHGTAWYSCNRYDEKAGVDARDAQSKSRASLERYLHYYNRWANHEQSAKLSVELYAKTEKKMEEMQISTELTWIEVQFMKKAVDEVEKCRTTLKWTYAMAYYLEKGNEKELFEDNQRDLEKAVEDLSELLENPIDAETIPTLRQKVTDKTVYVSKRNEILLEDTAAGYNEDRWKWNSPMDA
ncbi:uncharacterized protein STEHIDRAFT_172092 [Stereum hirsutum FP-91666 SS1]|uniref:uncharacterized protein n=1 Tax=Stereum hirsutum (strain FP-91666) TaxID=721885 RepID=UPI0004449807|nr:uncharacterized protein STEHIDRAFT_172092 [Stereum hirsutum FP-91666 SS1]EIM81045.1 hypothetical protein STEHIDRAFT_172092 [Stereum hirsutum FP-91666 SS1]